MKIKKHESVTSFILCIFLARCFPVEPFLVSTCPFLASPKYRPFQLTRKAPPFASFRPLRSWLGIRKESAANTAASTNDETEQEPDVGDTEFDQQLPPVSESNWTCPNCTADEPTLPELAARTLDGRLLCATQCSYNVSAPYFRGASYVPGTVAKRVSRGVNSAFVGRTVDGVVVAFRGTKASSPLDWLQNAALFLSAVPNRDGIQGKVHTGFYRAVKSLWNPLKKEILDLLVESDKKEIYLTGHSKGGAMASIAAMLIQRDEELPNPAYVATFGAAKLGDTEFRNEFNGEINQTTYENYLDLIPFLPPSEAAMEVMSEDKEMMEMVDGILWSDSSKSKKEGYRWDYQQVGSRRYIDEDGGIEYEVTRELDDMRIRDIENRTFLSIKRFSAAHCSSCPGPEGECDGGYFLAAAKEVCDECSVQ